ncbi:hypothetical protein LCGC14_1423740 [marine sediment metagenome]|uniref:Uncharacterized protein n=1 Tax=marine sediment metagenome TaxID=412755 RepID=A0A0F9KBN1_9ZZZZ
MILLREAGSALVMGTVGGSIVSQRWEFVVFGVGLFLWMTYILIRIGEFKKPPND